MERSEAYGFSGAMSGAFLLSCLLFAAISRRQRGPYMDEVFHVPQAQAYCQGRFLQSIAIVVKVGIHLPDILLKLRSSVFYLLQHSLLGQGTCELGKPLIQDSGQNGPCLS
ncbi:hypothetical protein WISP_39444 [Willisornis vidua]|uniref:Dol-P-Glc:Glc(2)Man(9)GlcNAc(2)-PP-Dol alpha-1,2-glucosyltransferase n=1 Tax=Willisornis vidua TaxID=1566151 RepID=A0ABQ9DNG7_9PASS|nr:hypothetical protein WISP_39444 [Willisornis vidua]